MHSKLDLFSINGKILMLALDHRGSFVKLMANGSEESSISTQAAANVKSEIISSVYDLMSGVLFDKDFGLPAYTNLPEHSKPYLLPIEETGYTDYEGDRVTKLKYTVEDLKKSGASGVKILVYYHPDSKTKNQQIETAGAVMEMSKENDLPYFLELVTYNHKEDEFLVVDSVKDFVKAGVKPDVFKLEYPGSENACLDLSTLIGDIPWILLTKGANFDTFARSLEIAHSAGCNGFLAGRSLWQEGVSIKDDGERKLFFNTTARERFQKISDIIL